MYVHKFDNEQKLWLVGFYQPTGEFYSVIEFKYATHAAAYVNYLNGGTGRPPYVEGG